MITSIDTNVLLDILIPNEEFYDASANALQSSADAGSLVICDLVYAELCVHFGNQRDCDQFLESNDVHVHREAHFLASRVWRAYHKQGGKRARILADFLIASHAQKQASRLLSRDRGIYRTLFPSMMLYDPQDTK
jgi:predicted nucleic acid-binding protein